VGKGHFSILAFLMGGVRRRWLLEIIYHCCNGGITSGNRHLQKEQLCFVISQGFRVFLTSARGTGYYGIAVMD
jgi:hypothetical protein